MRFAKPGLLISAASSATTDGVVDHSSAKDIAVYGNLRGGERPPPLENASFLSNNDKEKPQMVLVDLIKQEEETAAAKSTTAVAADISNHERLASPGFAPDPRADLWNAFARICCPDRVIYT